MFLLAFHSLCFLVSFLAVKWFLGMKYKESLRLSVAQRVLHS